MQKGRSGGGSVTARRQGGFEQSGAQESKGIKSNGRAVNLFPWAALHRRWTIRKSVKDSGRSHGGSFRPGAGAAASLREKHFLLH